MNKQIFASICQRINKLTFDTGSYHTIIKQKWFKNVHIYYVPYLIQP